MDLGAAALSDDEWADTAVLRGPRPPGGGACANDPEGWRDSHSVVIGPAAAPPGWRDEQTETPLGPALRTSARRSSSRSPRRDGEAQLPATLAPPPLENGHLAFIQHLAKRPELNGERVRLVEFDATVGRWVCVRSSGEKVRLYPEKLQALHAAFQHRAEQGFLKDGDT